jgi:hypothetical protein
MLTDESDSLPVKDKWGPRKEIAELPNILRENENIKAITSGVTDGNTWLVVCYKGMIYGLKLVDIPLDRINSDFLCGYS